MLARGIAAVQFRPLRSDLSVCRCCCLFEFRDQADCSVCGDSNERANEIGHHRAIIESANEKRAVSPQASIQSVNPIMFPGDPIMLPARRFFARKVDCILPGYRKAVPACRATTKRDASFVYSEPGLCAESVNMHIHTSSYIIIGLVSARV